MRGRIGVVAPVAALAVFGVAAFSAHAWLLDSAFVYLLVMLLCGLGGLIGGYLGARIAKRLGRTFVRRAVVVIGLMMGIALFFKR